jgi:hypothetical protein
VIASTCRFKDGRENLAVTAANNPNFIHSELLSYGLINWVTKEGGSMEGSTRRVVRLAG